jgi:hypothetical protein
MMASNHASAEPKNQRKLCHMKKIIGGRLQVQFPMRSLDF